MCRSSRSILLCDCRNGDQQDICNLTTMPCVQRSLYLNELTDDFGNKRVEVPKGVDGRTRDVLERCMATCGWASGTSAKMRSRVRKEASAQEVQGYYKQFAEARHLEYRSQPSRKTTRTDDGRPLPRRTKKVTSSRQKPDGYW